jgi:glycosyltransferase involved in cell wall biosynthesis
MAIRSPARGADPGRYASSGQRTLHAVTDPQLLTVVMPVYNEEKTLRTAVERLLKTDLPVPVEVLIVDDGSVDKSTDTVADLEEQGVVRIVRHPRNRGKGAAVRTGIAEAQGTLLTILDADLEYDPADYRQLLAPILAGEAKVAYGTRTFGAHTAYSFWHVIGNRFITLWASFLFNAWLTDIETCLKVAETELWRGAKLTSKGFGMEAEITAKFLRAGLLIYEAPINYRARTREEGKKLTYRDGLVAVWVLARVRFLKDDRAPVPSPGA